MTTWAACCITVSFGGVLPFGGVELKCSWLLGHLLAGTARATSVGEGAVICSW